MTHTGELHGDLDLARRLELCEGHSTARSVDARAELQSESGAGWTEIAGTLAMFDGAESPLTQTFGLGLAGLPTESDMEAIEAFFGERGAPVFHEVSPVAGADLMAVLNRRGYEAFECTNVLVRPIGGGAAALARGPLAEGAATLAVRLVESDPGDEWAKTSARGWGEVPGLEGFMRDIGPITARRRGAHRFLADIDGRPVAAALLSIEGDVALLAGASTEPAARRKGAQLALLDARLRYAARRGCTLAMMCAMPGSGSQRNAERHGFRVVYTRIKWRRRG